MENELGKRIKVLQSDKEREFASNEFANCYTSEGI